MSLLPDFLIKHVRPCDMDAYVMIAAPGPGTLTDFLQQSGMTALGINTVYTLWHQVAMLPVTPVNVPQFANAANAVSQARWSEYYQTNQSTILFLKRETLEELIDASERNLGMDFDFRPEKGIPLAITIHQNNASPATFVINAHGAQLTSDNNGNCSHFMGLIP